MQSDVNPKAHFLAIFLFLLQSASLAIGEKTKMAKQKLQVAIT